MAMTREMLIASVWLCWAGYVAASPAGEQPFTFKTWNGQQLDALRGSLAVPENRASPRSRQITIRYVRLPAAAGNEHAPPIVYLAGGPGASGIEAINYRYEMFMAMRQYGDVIALDQRGTGSSNDVPSCRSRRTLPTSRAIS